MINVDNLKKAMDNLSEAAYSCTESIMTIVSKELRFMQDGFVGSYKGHDIYYCDSKDYFDDPNYFDGEDVIWLMTDTDLLIHRGKVMGKLRGKSVETVKYSDIYSYYPEKKNVKTSAHTESAKKLGNPTKSVLKPITVTERKSVEWYMQHTIDVLNEGVKYGEQRLRDSARK